MEAQKIFDDALFKHDFSNASKFLNKIDIDYHDESGNTYLMKACARNDLKVFKWLIENNASLDVRHQSGRNILFMAIHNDSLEIVQWFIGNSRLLETTYKGCNPLHEAVSTKRLSMVMLLVNAGINPNVQNQNKANAFDLALTINDEAILEWLLTNESFKILDEVQNEQAKITTLQDLFNQYGYQHLNKLSRERNLTIANYAFIKQQNEVLEWLKSSNTPVDEIIYATTPTTNIKPQATEVISILKDLFDKNKDQYTEKTQFQISKLLESEDDLDEEGPVMVPINYMEAFDKTSSGHNVLRATAPKADIKEFEAALFSHNFKVALTLLPKIDIETPDHNGNTYLMKACANNDAEVFKWLIQHKANIDVQDKSGRNLLFMAIHFKSLDIVKCLIDNKRLLNTFYKGRGPLHDAVLSNQLCMVKLLVAAKLDPETLTQCKMNAFDLAQNQNDKAVLEWLLTNRSFNILDNAQTEEVKLAMLQNLFEKYGCQYLNLWFAERNLTLAQHAAHMRYVQVLKWLKSKNIPVDETLLSDASVGQAQVVGAFRDLFHKYGHKHHDAIQTEVTNWFQSKTISVNAPLFTPNVPRTHTEAFEAALFNHNFDVALTLLPKINIEKQDYNGNTYLMKACVKNDAEIFDRLIQYGAKIDVVDKFGKNLLFMAIEAQSVDIVKRLVDDKRLLSTTNKGQTALHEAVLLNQLDMVKLLVVAGLDPNVSGRSKANAFDMAETQADKSILKWLLISRSFQILDEDQPETSKIAMLEKLFAKYGYQYLNATFAEKTLTIAEYAGNTEQVEVLNWLKSKNIQMPKTVLPDVTSTEKDPINILLLGETGVGKSTFINAAANYVTFHSLNQAVKAEVVYAPIASHFVITDAYFQAHAIQYGHDENETIKPGVSSTQAAKSYLFNYDNVKIQFIDTPGIGDTRGIGKDEENFKKVLDFIGDLNNIHGICIMLKPNNSRLNILFEYCMKGLLPRLRKNTRQNVVFVFTNSRGSFYKPGDTIVPLQEVLTKIKSQPPHISIPLNKNNVFCLDNEGFRFLLAKKTSVQITFNAEETKQISESWTISTEVCKRLLTYIKSFKPQRTQKTVSHNQVHRRISKLGPVLAEATRYIEMNIRRYNRYIKQLSDKSKSKDELKDFLVVPAIYCNVIPLACPATVCTNQGCVQTIRIEGVSHKNFTKLCHSPCYLKGVSKGIIGDPALSKCCTMQDNGDRKICKQYFCGHDFSEHMHIDYIIQFQEDEVPRRIKNKKIKRQDIETKLKELEKTVDQYGDEMNFIVQSMAKFAYHLKYQAIVPFKDTYETYMKSLINSERRMAGTNSKNLISRYEELISLYEVVKNDVEDKVARLSEYDRNTTILSESYVTNLVGQLYNLLHTGKIIKQLHTY